MWIISEFSRSVGFHSPDEWSVLRTSTRVLRVYEASRAAVVSRARGRRDPRHSTAELDWPVAGTYCPNTDSTKIKFSEIVQRESRARKTKTYQTTEHKKVEAKKKIKMGREKQSKTDHNSVMFERCAKSQPLTNSSVCVEVSSGFVCFHIIIIHFLLVRELFTHLQSIYMNHVQWQIHSLHCSLSWREIEKFHVNSLSCFLSSSYIMSEEFNLLQ